MLRVLEDVVGCGLVCGFCVHMQEERCEVKVVREEVDANTGEPKLYGG